MTINTTRLGIVEQWLAAHGLTSSLLFYTDPDCGTKTGKIYDLGTTWLPRGGDFTIGGGTSINATGVNGRPAWVNASGTDQGYWGGGRYNNIRRKRQITFAVLYERTQTSTDITLIGSGPFMGTAFDGSKILAVRHTSGTPGTVQFVLSDGVGAKTATVTAAASSGPLVAICTYDGTNMVAYSGASSAAVTAGTANSSLDPNPNFGDHAGLIQSVLAGGRLYLNNMSTGDSITVAGFGFKDITAFLGSGSKHNYNLTPSSESSGLNSIPELHFEEAQAQFKAATVLILENGIDSTTAAELNKLLFSLPGSVSKNLMSDYGAAGNGSTDDSAKFNTFATAALADFPHDYALTLTTGHNFKVTGTAQFWTAGIRNLTVNATGATVTAPSGQLVDFGAGNIGLTWSTQHAFIATVTAGADRVTLLTPAEASRFAVGNYVMAAGLLIQKTGDPPNLYFFEFVKIIGIAGDTIMFDRRLRNTYKSTWPAYGTLGAGPACIVLCTTWDSDITYNGGTWDQVNGGHTKARKVSFNGTQFLGSHGFTVSGSDIVNVVGNAAPSAYIEVDKLTSVATFKNGSTGMGLQIQSAVPSLMAFDNYELTDTANGLAGTVKHVWIRNGSHIVKFKTGPFYGVTKSITAEDSAIDQWNIGVGFDYGGPTPQIGVPNVYTITAGVIRIPIASMPDDGLNLYVPGTVLFFTSDYPYTYQQSFKVLDVRTDGTYVYVDTNLAISAFPTPVGGGLLGIISHPCPRLTVRNCTGSTASLDYSTAPAGAPLGSWSFRTYTEANLAFSMGSPLVFGRVQQLRFNVTTANAGGGVIQMIDTQYIKADGSVARYTPKVNLAVTGERIETPGGTPVTFSGDTGFGLPAGAWFPGPAYGGPSGVISTGTVRFTIKITTDQEATADADTDEAVLYAMARVQLGLTAAGALPKVFTCTFV